MDLNFSISSNGIRLNTKKGKFKLSYPKTIWKKFPSKEKQFFLDNIAYLNTVCMPLVSGEKQAAYSTRKPLFKGYFDRSIKKDIPSAVEAYKPSTKEMMEKFRETSYSFASGKSRMPSFSSSTKERAVIPFSCGKDSLLTLGVSIEAGLNPVPVYINDTVSPTENRLKLGIIKKISKENRLKFEIIKNEIEKLNDFEFWGKGEAEIGYSHMIMSFCFLPIPVASYYNAKYLIMGNELDLNSKMVNKDGISCYPSYDQSIEGTKSLSNAISKATKGKVCATSIISPLYDLAIMKVLHSRYPLIGKHQSSCPSLDGSDEKRWCYACPDCAKLFVYMAAIGSDTKSIGIKNWLFGKRFIKYHTLFGKRPKGRYEKASGDEQIKFAYYLAYRNGAKGYIIDKFKKKFLEEIKEKEGMLYKKYFGVHSAALIPRKIRNPVISIYKEELGSF